jgi:hypothetical protein
VAEADPQARLVDESTVPLDLDSLGQQGPPDDFSSQSVAPAEVTPEDVEAIARRFEERWLDDSIPALGGETPREAAQSSRRGDLVALLDDFEWEQRRAPSPFDMDLARLRRELGIDG